MCEIEDDKEFKHRGGIKAFSTAVNNDSKSDIKNGKNSLLKIKGKI